MQSVSVHIAVLAVGKDAAPTHTISELATQAGHDIVARATVSDTTAAIRGQLTRWIEDANIDVIVVSGGVESEHTSAVMKPLVTQALPGFTDLFRYLAFQEIGASAMTSNAEAAQCGSTFVFVLPASAGAVRAAMEKLILPQLDSTTTPKNLVQQMPRVLSLGDDGVPVPIVKEKTASGSGLAPKHPSRGVVMPRRERQLTDANVIRKVEADPPTKQIALATLEKQIALSASPPNDAETRQIDLSRLPNRPPGADLSEDTEQILSGESPTVRHARLSSEAIEPPSPSPRRQVRTDVAAVVPPPQPAGKLLPDPPAPRGPIAMPDTGHDPVAPLPSIAPVPAARSKTPTDAPQPARTKAHSGPIGVPAVIPKSLSGPTRKAPTHPPNRPETGPSPVVRKAPTAPPPSPPARPRPPTGSAPTVKPPEPVEAPALVALPPTPPSRRAPSAPPPPTPPKRTPTQPPPPPRRNDSMPDDLVSAPLVRASGDLPSGTFNYPVKQAGGSKLVFALAAIAMLAIGFVLVVFVVPRGGSTPAGAGSGSSAPVVSAIPIDAAVAVVPDPEPDIELDPQPALGSAATTPTPPSTPTPTPPPPTPTRPVRGTTPPTPGPVTKPATPVTKPEAGSAVVEDTDNVENAPNNPQPTASDCDEVSCVLAKYDRPCCAVFKPKESDIKPRVGGLPAELDKAMVRTGIEKVKPRVVACGEKSPEKGTVKISVTVRPDGVVSAASIVSAPNDVLGDCVTAAVKKAEFGKSVGGGSFTYPFVF